MSVTVNETAFSATSGQTINFSSLVNVTASASNPAYIVVSIFDENNYTKTATGTVGSVSGNGVSTTLPTSDSSGDHGMGIVFTYNSTTGQYTNSTYGNLESLSFKGASLTNDMTNISIIGLSGSEYSALNPSALTNPMLMELTNASDYIGSATVIDHSATIPSQATPNSVVAAAMTFVGQAWNQSGCWILASNIAAEAGAGLPFSAVESVAGTPNGEWFVAYNGTGGQTNTNWESLLQPGEIVSIPGHVTTVVSGSGASALLVDNESSKLAADNSDIIISAPHSITSEFANVSPNEVVIYELDAPIVINIAATGKVTSAVLSSMFTVSDPNNTAIKAIQVYDSATGTTINGTAADGVANAITLTSLSGVTFTDANGAADVIMVRAENALGYWGDWTAEAVNGGTVSTTTTTTTTSGPVAAPIADQTWNQGKAMTFALPSGTFTDSKTMTYTATLSSGAALPSWLKFNATNQTFSGTVPAGASDLSITVTAKDSGGLSTTDTFNLDVALNPIGKALTTQTWKQGQTIDYTIPNGSFTDPNGQALTYSAKLSNGSALPSWLSINSATGEMTGTAPNSSNMSIIITATDTSGLSVSETLAVTMDNNPTAPTIATQTWKQGQAVSFVVPAFTDPNKQILTYTATEADGSALPSWLKFNAANHSFTGTVPANTGDFSIKVTATDSSGLSVSDTFSVNTLLAPTIATGSFQTQTWLAGESVDSVLPSGTFTDPNGQNLTYSAKLSNGAALPTWLHINTATGELTGTAPATITNMTIVETAKDTSGLSSSVDITVTGIKAPTVAHHEANQTFKQGQTINLALSTEFSDPQHQTLTYAATEKGGAALPSWLSFNTTTDTFTGTVPASAGTINVVVTATNASGLSTTDNFNLTTVAAPVVVSGSSETATFLAGVNNSLTLTGAFVDPQNQKMTYTATLESGAALPSWLHFNGATDTFTGKPMVGNLSINALEALTPTQWDTFGPAPVNVTVTAHNASGLTASETFTIDTTNVGLVGISTTQTHTVHF